MSFAEPRKIVEADDSRSGWLLKFLMALLTTISFSARAELVDTSGERPIYRYIEKSTCYTIITTVAPAPDEVASFLSKGAYKSDAHCGREAQERRQPVREVRQEARAATFPSEPPPLPSFAGYSAKAAVLHLPSHAARTRRARLISARPH